MFKCANKVNFYPCDVSVKWYILDQCILRIYLLAQYVHTYTEEMYH